MSAVGEASLYVTGFPPGCDEEKVRAVFSQFGTVVSVKVLPPHPQKPDVAAIISMESAEKAKWVVDNVSGQPHPTLGLTAPLEIKLKNSGWGGKGWADSSNNGALYVSGLPVGIDDEKVKAIFSQYGPVEFVKVLRPHADKPDVAAIVGMVSPEQAKTLIENVSGTIPAGLSSPVDIKAKHQSPSYGKGWGGYNMDPWAMMQMFSWKGGKGNGKGKWGGGRGGLSSFPAEKKVWVGNLPEDVTFSELQDHFGGNGVAKFAAVMKGKSAGTGGVAFSSDEDAANAIKTLNGSSFKGAAIIVDVWTKKEAATA
jgi:RNA recognition motif-containing protein